jgi:hypothetical protein
MPHADGDPLPRAYAHPITGEIVGLDRDLDDLAADFAELNDLKRNAEAALRKLDVELHTRLGDRRRVSGEGWEVTASRRRVWDGDELEGVLEDLYHRGRIRATDVPNVVRREVKVSGGAALSLAERLPPADRAEITRCATWRPGRVEVAPVAYLTEETT